MQPRTGLQNSRRLEGQPNPQGHQPEGEPHKYPGEGGIPLGPAGVYGDDDGRCHQYGKALRIEIEGHCRRHQEKKERPELRLPPAQLSGGKRPIGHGDAVHIYVAAVIVDIGAGYGAVGSDGCQDKGKERRQGSLNGVDCKKRRCCGHGQVHGS